MWPMATKTPSTGRVSSAPLWVSRSTTPVTVVMWLTNTTRVRGVMASATRERTSAALAGGRGSSNFFTTMP